MKRKLVFLPGPSAEPVLIGLRLTGLVPSVPQRPGNYLATALSNLPEETDGLGAVRCWFAPIFIAAPPVGKEAEELPTMPTGDRVDDETLRERLSEPCHYERAKDCLDLFLRHAGAKPILVLGSDSDFIPLIGAVARSLPRSLRRKCFFSTFESVSDFPDKLAIVGVTGVDGASISQVHRRRFAAIIDTLTRNPDEQPQTSIPYRYASLAIGLLRAGAWHDLDELISCADKFGLESVDDLELVAILCASKGSGLGELNASQFVRLLGLTSLARWCNDQYPAAFEKRLAALVDESAGASEARGLNHPPLPLATLEWLQSTLIGHAHGLMVQGEWDDFDRWERTLCTRLSWYAEKAFLQHLLLACEGSQPPKVPIGPLSRRLQLLERAAKFELLRSGDRTWRPLVAPWLVGTTEEIEGLLSSDVDESIKGLAVRQHLMGSGQKSGRDRTASPSIENFLSRPNNAQLLGELFKEGCKHPIGDSPSNIVLRAAWCTSQLLEWFGPALRDQHASVNWKLGVLRFLADIDAPAAPSGGARSLTNTTKSSTKHSTAPDDDHPQAHRARFIATHLDQIISQKIPLVVSVTLVEQMLEGIGSLNLPENLSLLKELVSGLRGNVGVQAKLSNNARERLAHLDRVARFAAGERLSEADRNKFILGLNVCGFSANSEAVIGLLQGRLRVLPIINECINEVDTSRKLLSLETGVAQRMLAAALVPRAEAISAESHNYPSEGRHSEKWSATEFLIELIPKLDWQQIRRIHSLPPDVETRLWRRKMSLSRLRDSARTRFWVNSIATWIAVVLAVSAATVLLVRTYPEAFRLAISPTASSLPSPTVGAEPEPVLQGVDIPLRSP